MNAQEFETKFSEEAKSASAHVSAWVHAHPEVAKALGYITFGVAIGFVLFK